MRSTSREDQHRWRKSTFSSGAGTECVQVALIMGGIAARDSKDPSGPVLGFTRGEWKVFLDEVKSGAFDHA